MSNLSEAQRDQIVTSYQISGYDTAAAVAVAHGVSTRHVAKLLRERGIKNTSRRGRKCNHVNGPTQCNDPRWKWAVERGAVLA